MSVTLILIIITVGISIYAWSNQELLQKWIFHPYSVRKKHEYYRFITSGFLHADWTHLLFNMFSFFMFDQVVEHIFTGIHGAQNGVLFFLLVYIGGIIVSDIYTFFKQHKNYNYHSLGASGGGDYHFQYPAQPAHQDHDLPYSGGHPRFYLRRALSALFLLPGQTNGR
jgi:membrane associated rhomboid family serine protease